MSKLFVIEGIDGTGKATQTEYLRKNLSNMGYRVKSISFPWYDDPSSTLVKMYLSGEVGSDPMSVTPYAASTFYAVDRFATFKRFWEKDYRDPDCILIADRYVGSNAIHQGCKCARSELRDFLDWLYDLEFLKYDIPVPTATLWLDMDPDISQKLMEHRKNKFTGDQAKDIHEVNHSYLKKCYDTGRIVGNLWGWHSIFCSSEDHMRTVEDIAADILNYIQPFLGPNR